MDLGAPTPKTLAVRFFSAIPHPASVRRQLRRFSFYLFTHKYLTATVTPLRPACRIVVLQLQSLYDNSSPRHFIPVWREGASSSVIKHHETIHIILTIYIYIYIIYIYDLRVYGTYLLQDYRIHLP